jgi:hypothetical protein
MLRQIESPGPSFWLNGVAFAASSTIGAAGVADSEEVLHQQEQSMDARTLFYGVFFAALAWLHAATTVGAEKHETANFLVTAAEQGGGREGCADS